jgi:hypothetical protein
MNLLSNSQNVLPESKFDLGADVCRYHRNPFGGLWPVGTLRGVTAPDALPTSLTSIPALLRGAIGRTFNGLRLGFAILLPVLREARISDRDTIARSLRVN